MKRTAPPQISTFPSNFQRPLNLGVKVKTIPTPLCSGSLPMILRAIWPLRGWHNKPNAQRRPGIKGDATMTKGNTESGRDCGRQFCNWLGQGPGRVLCSYGYQLSLSPTRLALTSMLEAGGFYLMLG